MQFSKPNFDDINAAKDFYSLLLDVSLGYYPQDRDPENCPAYFDPDNKQHLRELYDRIIEIMDASPGWHARIIGGMLWVILNPANQLLDPTKDVLALHPDLIQGRDYVQHQRATMLDRMEYQARVSVAWAIERSVMRHQNEMATASVLKLKHFYHAK